MKAARLAHFFCLGLLLGAGSALAEPAGHVQSASGETWIYSRAERARHLGAGEAFGNGVSISTGANSSLLLRFEDGQVVVLASGTTLRVKNFVFDAQQPGKGELQLELVKGRVRCVTGSVGEKNPGGWLLETPAGNLGIAGTDFFAAMDQGLYTRVNTGAVTMSNGAGATTISAGGTGFASSAATIPAAVTTVPDGVFAEVQAIAPASSGAAAAGGGSVAAAGAGTSAMAIGGGILVLGIAAAAVAAGGNGSSPATTHH